jgi:hypothetical protein
MAHLWFGRRSRSKFAWKSEQKRVNHRSALKQTLVSFMSRKLRGFRARCRFEQQLHVTWEKVWDVSSQRLFWFNHQTGEASWDKPRLLMRYGDVENPHPWVLLEPNNREGKEEDKETQLLQQVPWSPSLPSPISLLTQFLSVCCLVGHPRPRPGPRPELLACPDPDQPPGESLPSSLPRLSLPSRASHCPLPDSVTHWQRKPDGYPLCHRCSRNLATRSSLLSSLSSDSSSLCFL